MKLDTDRPVDLIALAGLTGLLLLVVFLLPENPLRVALGLPFILFFPGYALVAALFPERHREYEVEKGDPERPVKETVSEGLDALERVALSFGLSIAVVPLIGLGLNYTPWGIRLVPILVSVTAFILLASGVAALRRARLDPEDRFRVRLEVTGPAWGTYSPLDKALTIGLALSVVIAGAALAYVLVTPRTGERFTEFYVLGPGGMAEGYPTNLTAGNTTTLILGVVNHENEGVTYAVRTQWLPVDNATGNASGPPLPGLAFNVTLAHEEAWEENVTLAAPAAPGYYKLQFLLDRPGAAAPYRELHLWIEVLPATG